jgi:hypothetical protein
MALLYYGEAVCEHAEPIRCIESVAAISLIILFYGPFWQEVRKSGFLLVFLQKA